MSIGFGGLLAIVFIVLKLLHKVAWPWIWVLSPLWIGTALFIVMAVLGLGFTVFVRRVFFRH
jgi:hypothetical protein